ncbi:MAG: UDP-3-O-(3-hydroxymyristoyl)glucosamine N-acyltransferase [Saprospiraceae bacterium]|nr:UDP-3-O-(3-hydroxymyristoyl)glucosamine N-acyltransferase [Saprospiraceae bacterium]MBK9720045.1 UDP-3-O-(3-hydroxymyristoyl)glucosamine N-acyltransferase [Saprospiraceae bacterium]
MYNYNDIQNCLKDNFKILGDPQHIQFDNAKSLTDANSFSICWLRPGISNRETLIDENQCKVFICSEQEEFREMKDKVIILVDNPRLRFLQLVRQLFVKPITYGIHPTAIIHEEAQISSKVYIGPNCIIGKCIIGDDVVIYGNCYLFDDVQIGNHTTIMPNSTIGGIGFGYERNADSEFELFPHLGGVIIEDHVDIGANTCIDRGTLGNTIIKSGTKIDNLVHIAHNVVIGKNCAVIALAMIGGSTVIGDNCWVAPASTLRDGIKIGTGSTIGIGALVLKEIPDNETWIGVPAKKYI